MIKTIVVDEQELFRLGVRCALKQAKSNIKIIDETENAKKLFLLLPKKEVDLLLLGDNLPDMSCVEVCRILKNEYPGIKILVISLNSSANAVEQLIEVGVNGILCKRRAGAIELIDAIHTIMNGQEYFDSDIAACIYKIITSKTKVLESINDFSKKERNIIELSAKGMCSKEIAEHLALSLKTIENYKQKIFRKLGVNSTANMVICAVNIGIINIDF
jgi:DNA-binding NarL/FixJ family response regulator